MPTLNKVQLIGNIGRDPEIRYLPDGTPTASVSLATNERYKKKGTDEVIERAEWHRLVFFRGLAEIVEKWLVQGSTIYVEGKLKTRKWQDKEGKDVYTTEVRVESLQMLGGKRKDEGAAPPEGQHNGSGDGLDEDVPF
jgi:single-strand DNA-binding protein